MPLEKDDYKPGANPTDEQQVAYCKNQEKKYREQQNKILIELKEKFKQSCLNFNKFNLPILAKSADFQAYQLRYLNSHLLGDLRKTCDELITLLEQMQSQNEKVANDNKLSINFKKFITQLTTLKSNINEYVVNLQNNDTVQCSNLFKLVAEALQRLQYSLMHAFDAPDNPQEAFVDFKLLPGEILYKIANDYLSAKEGWSLALTCKGFFGKAPSNIDMAYVVKRKKTARII